MKKKDILYILNLDKVGLEDIDLVGGKNASLGEMMQNLSKLRIQIPKGFAITTLGYYDFIQFNDLESEIKELLENTDVNDLVALSRAGSQIRKLILKGSLPKSLIDEVTEAYNRLSNQYDQQHNVDVAVRSSATAEDLPNASFAGQQETYLNIEGVEMVLDSIVKCYASIFTDRAISYRESFGFDHFQVGLSVCIQKMIRSDMGASGVAFSMDTESGFKDVVLINGAWGLGEMIVQGAITPDEFIVFKPLLNRDFQPIIEKKLGEKDRKMVYGYSPGKRTEIEFIQDDERWKYCLSDENVLKLAKWVYDIEDFYSKKKGSWCPMDIEWALDGTTNELFILQARPETVHSGNDVNIYQEYKLDTINEPIVTGISVGDKISNGSVMKIKSAKGKIETNKFFKEGSVLVADMTDPDWEPLMKKASAIVTNKGGRTCHAAIVARELGIPAIVGCKDATEKLSEGQEITVSCGEGEEGKVFEGLLNIQVRETVIEQLPDLSTALMLNVGSPAMAFRFTQLPNHGVGLAREEFIISNYIKIHPLALLQHSEVKDNVLTDIIHDTIRGFHDEKNFFVRKLSYGIAKIAAAFYPKDVIVRFSDFKSNEYRNLIGGEYFEPQEENPMMGWRGASRYYSEKYKDAFELECKAIKEVRESMGLSNVKVMVPFCRTVEELVKVQEVMTEFGLERGKNGLEVFLMAELPSNILMATEFAKYIDGFSIGSNDLTQFALGLDRDSSLVAHLYDERDETVKKMISILIKAAKKANVKVGICGQGPSDFPDFVRFLIDEGVDSISVTPDSVMKVIKELTCVVSDNFRKRNTVSSTK